MKIIRVDVAGFGGIQPHATSLPKTGFGKKLPRMSREYVEDVRALKRMKSESKADWLVWRKGKFSSNELQAMKEALESYVEETCTESGNSRDEVLENLKWAKEKGVKAWCDIATRCSLPDRKIGAIRHSILRRLLPGSEMTKWTEEQTNQFIKLQEVYGPRAWKQLAQETGRTLEQVTNKGRQLAQAAKNRQPTSTRFPREEVFRTNLGNLLRKEADLYEFNAIRADCKLVALVRRYAASGGDLTSVHSIPSTRIAKKLNTSQDAVRFRWHHDIVPEIEKRVRISLADESIMNDFLILQARRGCKGTLTDVEGNEVFPIVDWNSIDWAAIMPMWSQTVTERRLTHILRGEAKFGILPLPEVVRAATKTLLENRSKTEITEAYHTHCAEFRKVINAIADRGDAYIKQDKLESKTEK